MKKNYVWKGYFPQGRLVFSAWVLSMGGIFGGRVFTGEGGGVYFGKGGGYFLCFFQGGKHLKPQNQHEKPILCQLSSKFPF